MMRRLPSFFLLLGLLTLYTGLHAQSFWPAHPSVGWAMIVALVGLMTVWQRVHRADNSDPSHWRYRFLAWIGTIAMGIWATFLFFCFAVDLLSLFVVIVGWIQPTVWSALATRARHLSTILVLLSAALAFFGLVQAVQGPRLVRVRVPVQGLHPSLVGLTIALVSDLHIGPTIRDRYVNDVVDRTMALRPDLIAVTGDLADESVDRITAETTPLVRLQAPLGTYFVTGNHEYYWNASEWIERTRQLGWIPLINDNRTLQVKDASLLVAGITDVQGDVLPGHTPDMGRAARGAKANDFRLLLAHRPGVYAEAERAGFDLQLSGHTHGGQFFPWSLVIPFVHRFYKDLNRFKKLWIYVSPGTGYWGPPHRFLVPSEITLLELVVAR